MRTPLPRMNRRARVTLIVLAAVVVLFMLLGWLDSVFTNYLWFQQVDQPEVYTTQLWTRVGLFFVFGVVVAAVVAVNLWLAFRFRPLLRFHSTEQQTLERYRAVIAPRFGLWAGLLAALIGFFAGLSAQGHWQQWLLFHNAQPFGEKDPQFGVDIGFYVFRYPFWRYLVGVGFTTVVLSLIAALAVQYIFGGVRLQGAGERITTAARVQLTSLVAAFVLLKSVAYVLDKRGLLLAHNSGTNLWGAGYTDVTALLPAKEILIWISVVVAVAILVFSNAFIRNLVWPGIAFGLLVISAIAIGGIYPAAVQAFTVKPNILGKEQPYIARSITATRAAFGLSDVDPQTYSATALAPSQDLAADANTVANIRLLDPSIVSDTYTQLQQVRGFYDFTQKLDIDRYDLGGKLQDYVLGVRELDYSKLPSQSNNWQIDHTIYTHGYGFVAAPANQTVCLGRPYFVSGFFDSTTAAGSQAAQQGCQAASDLIKVDQPRIYFGEGMGSYAVTGKASGGNDSEYDHPTGQDTQTPAPNPSPSASGSPSPNPSGSAEPTAPSATAQPGDQYVTYTGDGGVSVGSYWRRILYAWHFKETNFLISNVFNQNSQVLYVRDPRERVQKIAPFLRLDGDPYPVVVGGRITWVLDGYTTAKTYPYSDQVDLRQATSDSLTNEGTVPQAQENVNYLRNSVKATVDAYTGEVTLYQFDDNDPVIKAWNKAFGGKLIKPSSTIPAELREHFRYPEDQFKVQRDLLTRFHVTDPKQFYSGQDFWQVPDEPSPGPGKAAGTKQAPYYLLAQFPGQDQATFQLTAAMIPRNRQNVLSALITGYYDASGKPALKVLQIPPSQNDVASPSQAHQTMTNDSQVRSQITLLQGSAQVEYGNLLSLPVGNGMLYVEPLYVKSNGENSFPQLKYVLLNFGQYVGFDSTLQGAVKQLLAAAAAGQPSVQNPGSSSGTPPSTNAPNSAAVDAALAQLDQAMKDLKAAQASGDFQAYGKALQAVNDALNAYQAARAAQASQSPSPAPSGSPGATPSG
jgi:uncharacterized protein